MTVTDRLRRVRYRLSRIPAGLRRARRRLVPALRRLTGTSGRPDFIIAGAQKSGTSSVASWLAAHPQIRLVANPDYTGRPGEGEFHFFDVDGYFALGLPWYCSHFPRTGVRGEKTPSYLATTDSLDRIAAAFPDVRLVVLLRDPTTRAWSAYNHYTRAHPESRGWDWLVPGGSFEENLDAEEAHDFRSGFVHRSIYADQLEAVFDRFPRQNVFIGIFERMVAVPASVLDPLADFLGVNRRSRVALPRTNANRRPSPLPPHLAERLRRIYAGPNERLAALLGHDLPEWE